MGDLAANQQMEMDLGRLPVPGPTWKLLNCRRKQLRGRAGRIAQPGQGMRLSGLLVVLAQQRSGRLSSRYIRRNSIAVREKYLRSIEIIESGMYHYPHSAVCWSGGKDSMVLLHLMRECGFELPVIFSVNPGSRKYAFQDYVIREWSDGGPGIHSDRQADR